MIRKIIKGEDMKYIIKISMYGSFPGSPDHDYYSVDERTHDKIIKLMFRFKRNDTLEEALQIEEANNDNKKCCVL